VKNLTVRGIDEEMTDILKKESMKTGQSINSIILKLLREATGLTKKKRNRLFHDLDELAGTWSEEDERKFRENVKLFEKIDEEIWN